MMNIFFEKCSLPKNLCPPQVLPPPPEFQPLCSNNAPPFLRNFRIYVAGAATTPYGMHCSGRAIIIGVSFQNPCRGLLFRGGVTCRPPPQMLFKRFGIAVHFRTMNCMVMCIFCPWGKSPTICQIPLEFFFSGTRITEGSTIEQGLSTK